MKAFRFLRPRTLAEASEALRREPGAVPKAGGVDLLDRWKERVEEPEVVVGLCDVTDGAALRLEEDGALVLGALATLADLAGSDLVRRFLPALARAADQAASPQIRHRATLGGNLAQATRCGYWRLRSFPCLLRGASRCPVREPGGVQETAGIFANDPCASAHPSSVAPVLGALGAEILVGGGPEGGRGLAFEALWRAPEPGRSDVLALEPGELIRAVRIPPSAHPVRVGHAEVRQRAAFDWPLVTAAVGLTLDADRIREARVWLGSVAPTPHRARAAEAALTGRRLAEVRATFDGRAAAEGATPLPGTAYKAGLVAVAARRALADALERS